MTLHIIKSGQVAAIEQVSRLFEDQDQVLLIEDGCYLYTLAKQAFNNPVALSEHMKMRGLLPKAEAAEIELISFKDWALLTRNHQQSTTW